MYLASVALVVAASVALFSVSSFSLLHRSKQELVHFHSSDSPVQRLSISDSVLYSGSEGRGVPGPTKSRNPIKARDLASSMPFSASHGMQYQGLLSRSTSKLLLDEGARQPTPAQGSSTGEPRAPGVSSSEGAAVQPLSMSDGAAAAENSGTTMPTRVITDQEREQLFQQFSIQQGERADREHASPAVPQQLPAQQGGIGRSDNNAAGLSPSLRSRIARECGPIHDRQLYRHCVATFGVRNQ